MPMARADAPCGATAPPSRCSAPAVRKASGSRGLPAGSLHAANGLRSGLTDNDPSCRGACRALRVASLPSRVASSCRRLVVAPDGSPDQRSASRSSASASRHSAAGSHPSTVGSHASAAGSHPRLPHRARGLSHRARGLSHRVRGLSDRVSRLSHRITRLPHRIPQAPHRVACSPHDVLRSPHRVSPRSCRPTPRTLFRIRRRASPHAHRSMRARASASGTAHSQARMYVARTSSAMNGTLDAFAPRATG